MVKFWYRLRNDLKFYLDIERLTFKLIVSKLWQKELGVEKRDHKVYILFGRGIEDEGLHAMAFCKSLRQLLIYKNTHRIEGEIRAKMFSKTGLIGLEILIEKVCME